MPTDKQRTKKFNKEVKKQLKVRTRLQRDGIKEIERIIKVAQQRLNARLANMPTEFEQFLLPEIQNNLRQALAGLQGELSSAATTKLDEAFEAGIDLVDQPLAAGGVQMKGVLPAIDRSQLLALKSFMTDKMKDITSTIANNINTELGLVTIGAQQPHDAVKAIQKLLGDKGRTRALRVLRTEVLRSYSVASYNRQLQYQDLLPGLKKRWLPSGRNHARSHHEAARDQVRDVEEAFTLFAPNGIVRLQFPRDPTAGPAETINCGCESVPHMESWETANNAIAA